MPKIERFLRTDQPILSLKDSLEEAIGLFLGQPGPGEEQPACVVVADANGRPAGLVNAWLVLRALAIGAEKEHRPAIDGLMKDRLKLPVSVAMATDFPVLKLDDELLEVLGVIGTKYYECFPVMKGDQFLGVVRTIDLFQATAEAVLGGAGGLFTEQ